MTKITVLIVGVTGEIGGAVCTELLKQDNI